MREYMQAHEQQIPIAFVFSLFFRIIFSPTRALLRILNVISIFLIIFVLYKITKKLKEKYEINIFKMFFLSLTYFSLVMFGTFVYGDIPGLALCLISIYFTMKYEEGKKLKYIVFSVISMSIAYMLRMNSLIFIIASLIYLVLNLIKDFKGYSLKEKTLQIAIIVAYAAIVILPANLVINYYLNKYDMDKGKACPKEAYFLLAMEEGPRANGWYNESITEPALKDPKGKKIEYREKIKERIGYFAKNPVYAFNFYTMKITSMWCENTYSAIRNNVFEKDTKWEKVIPPLEFYQKALLLVTCISALVILLQNRKNISLELIFLLTIFVGGFAFHILWEAKSRYIIPYIVVLIPIASVQIKKLKQKSLCFRFNSKIGDKEYEKK